MFQDAVHIKTSRGEKVKVRAPGKSKPTSNQRSDMHSFGVLQYPRNFDIAQCLPG